MASEDLKPQLDSVRWKRQIEVTVPGHVLPTVYRAEPRGPTSYQPKLQQEDHM